MATEQSRKRAEPTAKRLRRDSTDAEMNFWQKVRSRQVDGFRFKRQCPVDGYIVDFICPELMLVVEIDGGQHNVSEKDKVRDEYLASKGLKTIRFWNSDVLTNVDGVLQKLSEELISLSSAREAGGGRGQGVRGWLSNTDAGVCGATPSSRPSPATLRVEEKEKRSDKNA